MVSSSRFEASWPMMPAFVYPRLANATVGAGSSLATIAPKWPHRRRRDTRRPAREIHRRLLPIPQYQGITHFRFMQDCTHDRIDTILSPVPIQSIQGERFGFGEHLHDAALQFVSVIFRSVSRFSAHCSDRGLAKDNNIKSV